MSCRTVRDRLLSGLPDEEILDMDVSRHLAECPACQRFRREHERYRRAVSRESSAEPSADFSARVLARLPAAESPADLLAWASLRCLPIGAALAVVLGLWAASMPPVLMKSVSDEALLLMMLEAPIDEISSPLPDRTLPDKTRPDRTRPEAER